MSSRVRWSATNIMSTWTVGLVANTSNRHSPECPQGRASSLNSNPSCRRTTACLSSITRRSARRHETRDKAHHQEGAKRSANSAHCRVVAGGWSPGCVRGAASSSGCTAAAPLARNGHAAGCWMQAGLLWCSTVYNRCLLLCTASTARSAVSVCPPGSLARAPGYIILPQFQRSCLFGIR